MRFEIRALDRSAGLVSLVLDAASPEAASAQALQQGLAVLRVRPEASAGWQRWLTGSGPVLALGQFSQELLTLLEAGLSIVESIETLREKETHTERRQLLGQLVNTLYQGESLSQALEHFPTVFPPLYTATVRASERTGDLAESLGRYVIYQNQLNVVRKKMISASIYPALLVGVGSLVIVFLLGYVVPRFARIFEDLGRDLPYLSRLLMDWGALVANHTMPLLAGVASVITLLTLWLRRPATRQALVARLMKIPALGERARVYQLARFYRTLGMLLRGGIPIMSSLNMTGGLLQGHLRGQLTAATRKISEGTPISQAMDDAGLTTPVSSRMLRVGERTGQMGEMMERIARFYDDEIARWVDWFIRLFEPVLMLIIGVAIGGIVVLMYFPIFELAGSLN
jgi:general secretion pathway protein F